MTAEQFTKLVLDYGISAAVFIAVVAALVVLKKAWPAITQFVIFVNVMAALPETIELTNERLKSLEGHLKEVHHEVHTNSGSSMADGVNRTSADVKEIKSALGMDPEK